MLTYSYKINTSTNKEEIEVNDFYISSDLSFISGTTSSKYSFGVGDKLRVNSDYYPKPQSLKVNYVDTVKRNGFLVHSTPVEIKSALYTETNETEAITHFIKYIEFRGNTYFQNMSDKTYTTFIVDDESCVADVTATTVNVRCRAYVEDGFVEVNGVKYGVFINSEGVVTFTDFEGNAFIKPLNWDVTYITNSYEYVKKFSLGNKGDRIIEVDSITRYGYRPYINYKGNRLYFAYIYNNEGIKTGFGVNIEGIDYAILDFTLSGSCSNINPYDKSSYLEVENSSNYLIIDDNKYQIFFDADYVDAGDIICITTKEEQLPILLEDKIILFNTNSELNIRLQEGSSGNSYVSLNGYRYNKVRNLCDAVIINGTEYTLEYEGDAEYPYIGMLAKCRLNDGGIVNFKVNELQSNGLSVRSLKKIKFNEDGKAIDAYTMALSGGTLDAVIYTNAQIYTVNNYPGVQIGNYNAKVLNYSSTDNGNLIEYEYIAIRWSQQYRLNVIDTIGSNRFLCKVDIDSTEYSYDDYNSIVDSIIDILVHNHSFSVLKKSSLFGQKELDYRDWLSRSLLYDHSVSVYELSDVQNKIHLREVKDYITFPISLSKHINNSLNQSDLVMNFHYDDVADDTINKIVDMDKDMYTPVFINSATGDIENVEEMEFNLHFRTRDLETWKIIEDEGEYDISGNTVPNSVNNQFSNWFITDYYPYNAYSNSGSTIYQKDDYFDKIVSQSDLLGLLYFTTNDVQVKRKKLSKSFLRITYFDSKDPINQNMLGTSTMYFDCERYYDTLYLNHSEYMFSNVVESIDWDRVHNGTLDTSGNVIEKAVSDRITVNKNVSPTVLTEVFKLNDNKTELSTEDLAILTTNPPRLDSRITVSDRYTSNTSSEGFYSYILKAFSNKRIEQTIYMKLEFFHAGIGIKIPMVVATDEYKQAIKNWGCDKLEKFKEGYNLDEIYDRLYVPVKISYSKKLRKFVYTIANENNHLAAARDGNKLRFNLFELKVKAQ